MPKLLYLKKDDLMRHEAAGITTDQFPPQLLIDNVSFALGYNFSPGKNDDGITLTVPLALINQVSAARCEWLVPGLLAEKVAAADQDPAAENPPQSGAGAGIRSGVLPRSASRPIRRCCWRWRATSANRNSSMCRWMRSASNSCRRIC